MVLLFRNGGQIGKSTQTMGGGVVANERVRKLDGSVTTDNNSNMLLETANWKACVVFLCPCPV